MPAGLFYIQPPMRRIIFCNLLAVTAGLITACGPQVVYERTVATGADHSGWSYADSVAYEFAIPGTDQAYDLELLITHGTSFPYENFYLNIHTEPPNGKQTTERISLELSGGYGEWYGDCSAESCELVVTLLNRTRFDRAGPYKITLEQNSRDSLLPQIESVGIRLTESSPE